MAKDKEKEKVVEPEEPKVLNLGSEFPEELNFICALCKVVQSRKNRDCPYLNIQHNYCSDLEKLRAKLVGLEHECDNHRKYIRAFQSKPFYTEEEVRQIFQESISTKTPISEDEFLDYCRTVGFDIV